MLVQTRLMYMLAQTRRRSGRESRCAGARASVPSFAWSTGVVVPRKLVRASRSSRASARSAAASGKALLELADESLQTKRITPHVLRHTAAMRLLQAGVDTSVIALWLGHEQVGTTQIYLHADLTLKERALARTTPANSAPGRYRPADPILAFLEGL